MEDDSLEILYVVASNVGGLPHYSAALANAVADHASVTVMKPSIGVEDELFDYRIDLIDAFEPTELSVVNIYNLDFHIRDNIQGMSSYSALRRIRELDPDVVHIPTGLFPHVQFFYWWYSLDQEYPTVMTLHEVMSTRPSLDELSRLPVVGLSILKRLLPSIDPAQFIVHTENNKGTLVERGISEDEVAVIPHGAYDFFTDLDYEEKPEEENTVIYFGNIVPHKAIDDLVHAIPLVAEEIPDMTLIIAGDGRIPDSATAVIEEHPELFEIHNEFIPNEKVGELFSRAQVAAMPYKEQGGNKGHSGSLMTAYSFGVPAVTTTAGEFEKLVGDAGAGLTVPPGSPKNLAKALIQILRNKPLRNEMEQNATDMANKLSWESLGARHVDRYKLLSAGD